MSLGYQFQRNEMSTISPDDQTRLEHLCIALKNTGLGLHAPLSKRPEEHIELDTSFKLDMSIGTNGNLELDRDLNFENSIKPKESVKTDTFDKCVGSGKPVRKAKLANESPTKVVRTLTIQRRAVQTSGRPEWFQCGRTASIESNYPRANLYNISYAKAASTSEVNNGHVVLSSQSTSGGRLSKDSPQLGKVCWYDQIRKLCRKNGCKYVHGVNLSDEKQMELVEFIEKRAPRHVLIGEFYGRK